MVRGDDFTTLGYKEQFKGEMENRFECKHRGRLVLAEDDDKKMRILNRIVTWTEKGI